MIALANLNMVRAKKLPGYDREEVRARILLLTVRDGTCTERWGDWHLTDNFVSYKDR